MQQGASLRIFSSLFLVLFSFSTVANTSQLSATNTSTSTPNANATATPTPSQDTSGVRTLEIIIPVAAVLIIAAVGVGYLSAYCQERCAQGYEELPSP